MEDIDELPSGARPRLTMDTQKKTTATTAEFIAFEHYKHCEKDKATQLETAIARRIAKEPQSEATPIDDAGTVAQKGPYEEGALCAVCDEFDANTARALCKVPRTVRSRYYRFGQTQRERDDDFGLGEFEAAKERQSQETAVGE